MDKKIKIISWALYDFANTIFATNVVSLYFPLWVTVQKNAPDKLYILPYYISMVLAAFILPLFGRWSDSFKKHSFFLLIFTLGCIFSTALIGILNSLYLGVIFFSLAILFNQAAGNVFYPALLVQICSSGNIAKVSGLGVALGYVGTILGLLVAKFFIIQSNYNSIFLPTAVLFLIFSLPCFIFVRDQKQKRKIFDLRLAIKEESRELIKTLKIIKANKIALRFFCAIMFIINGVNGVLLNIGVYGKRVIGFYDTELPIFILISTIFAFFSSFIFGFVTERLGPKRTLSFVLISWVLALTAVALIPQKNLCWVLGPIIGMLLAGTWVSSRPLIIKLAPEQQLGEFFGFTGLASIAGALISPPLWLFIITIFQPLGLIKYRVAVSMLAFLIAIGFMLLRKIPERKLI